MALDKKPLGGAAKPNIAKPMAKPNAAKPAPAKAAPAAKPAPAKAAPAAKPESGAVKNLRAEMFKKICQTIPGKIDNKTIVNAFEVLRKQQKLSRKDFSANLAGNETKFKEHIKALKNGYIEDQNTYTDMKYGESTVQFSGCEVIATYNALKNIIGAKTPTLPKLIHEYEKDGMIFNAKFGTSPKAAMDVASTFGLKSELVTDEAEFDRIGKTYDSMILTMYNNKDDISDEVHTINISKDNGMFSAHNCYGNGAVVGPYKTVTETIKNIHNGKAKGISLIGIKK